MRSSNDFLRLWLQCRAILRARGWVNYTFTFRLQANVIVKRSFAQQSCVKKVLLRFENHSQNVLLPIPKLHHGAIFQQAIPKTWQQSLHTSLHTASHYTYVISSVVTTCRQVLRWKVKLNGRLRSRFFREHQTHAHGLYEHSALWQIRVIFTALPHAQVVLSNDNPGYSDTSPHRAENMSLS